jgi:archaellum biogenesis protein FlaJ (TadC family)
LAGGHCGVAEEFIEKLIEKVREYVFLYDTHHPEYKNLVKKAEAWREIYASITVSFFIYNSVQRV